MDRDDRLRACYQHCVIIVATIEAGAIKSDRTVGGSRKYARYPSWA